MSDTVTSNSGNASPAEQVRSGAKRVAERAGDSAHDLQDAVKRNIAQSKEKVGDAVDAAAERVEAAHTYISRQAREKPVQTVALAMGAGLLLGLLMGGRRH